MKEQELKETIIAEYLSTGISYRELGAKYGMNFCNLHRCVMQYQGRIKKPTKNKSIKPIGDLTKESLPTDVKEHQAE